MGTDIHIYAEKLIDGTWSRLPIVVPNDRNYWAFAVLADVRNGYGFAGCDTGNAVQPISPPRGVPTDTSIHDSDDVEHGEPSYCWLGDHSHSYVTLAELRAVDLSVPIHERGFVSPEQAADLDAGIVTVPTSWCGGTTGKTWVRRSWTRPLEQAAWLIPKILDAFKDEREPAFVRFVFGFDS